MGEKLLITVLKRIEIVTLHKVGFSERKISSRVNVIKIAVN